MAPKRSPKKKSPKKSLSSPREHMGQVVVVKDTSPARKEPENYDDGMNFVAEYIAENTDGSFVKAIEELLVKSNRPPNHAFVFHNIKERILDLYEDPKKRWHPLYRALKYKSPENEVIVNMLMDDPNMCCAEKLLEYEKTMAKHKLSQSHIPGNHVNLLYMWTQFYLYDNKEESSSTRGTKILMLTIKEKHFKKCMEASKLVWTQINTLEKLNSGKFLLKSQLSYDILANLTDYNDVMANDVILKKNPELRYFEEQHKQEYADFISSRDLNAALKFRNGWKIVDASTTVDEIVSLRQREFFFNNETVKQQLKHLTEEQKEEEFHFYTLTPSARDHPNLLYESASYASEEPVSFMDNLKPELTWQIFIENSNVQTIVQQMQSVSEVSCSEQIQNFYQKSCEAEKIHPDIEFFGDINNYSWPRSSLEESEKKARLENWIEQQNPQSIPYQLPSPLCVDTFKNFGNQSITLSCPPCEQVICEIDFMDYFVSEPEEEEEILDKTLKKLGEDPELTMETDVEEKKVESVKQLSHSNDSDVQIVGSIKNTIVELDGSQTEKGLLDSYKEIEDENMEMPEESETGNIQTQNPTVSSVGLSQYTNDGRLFESEPTTDQPKNQVITEKPSKNFVAQDEDMFNAPSTSHAAEIFKVPIGHKDKELWNLWRS